jgi:hypothetical protein
MSKLGTAQNEVYTYVRNKERKEQKKKTKKKKKAKLEVNDDEKEF